MASDANAANKAKRVRTGIYLQILPLTLPLLHVRCLICTNLSLFVCDGG